MLSNHRTDDMRISNAFHGLNFHRRRLEFSDIGPNTVTISNYLDIILDIISIDIISLDIISIVIISLDIISLDIISIDIISLDIISLDIISLYVFA